MALHSIDTPEYRYYLADLLTNQIITEIPFTGVTYERALSKAGSFHGTIPVIDATKSLNLYESTMPGKTAVYVLRNGVCVWGGIIWGRQYSPNNKTLQVDGTEFLSYFYHRSVWQTLYYGSEGVYCSKYSANGTTATIFTDVEHGFSVGDKVRIRSLNSALNGDHVIQTKTLASFTFAVTNGAVLKESPSSTGFARTIVDTYDIARDLIGYAAEDFSTLAFENDEIKPANDLEYSILNKQMTSGIATLTTTLPHDLIFGQQVQLVDVDPLVNGYQVITSIPSSTTFKVSPSGVSSSFASSAVTPLTAYNVVSAEITNNVVNLTKKSSANNVVTLTTEAAHGIAVGDYVSITNVANYDTFAKTGSGAQDSYSITVSDTTSLLAGMNVAGTGIPGDAVVYSIVGNTVQLTQKTTVAVSGTVTFTQQSIINGSYYVTEVPSTTKFSFVKTTPTLAETPITKFGDILTYAITANTAKTAFVLTGLSETVGVENRNIYLVRGQTYTFSVNANANKVWIQTTGGAYNAANVYSAGITNNGASTGTITFVVPKTAPSTLYFQGQTTTTMTSTISVIDYGQVAYKSAVLTTSTPHGLVRGKSIVVENVGSDYDGEQTVSSVVDSTTIKFNSISLLTRAAEAVFGGTLKWGGRAVAGTYGAFTGNSDPGIGATDDVSGKYIGVSQQIYRGSDLRSVGEILEEFSKDLNGFEYRIDCDFQNGQFLRTFTFVPFIDPPSKVQVTTKSLTSNIATLTTSTAHKLIAGQEIVVSNVGLYFDGTQIVLSTPTTTTFTFQSYTNNVPGTPCLGYIGLVHPLSVLGADRYVFEYPGNVLDFSLQESAENSATRMWVAGNTDGLDNNASQPYAASTSTDMLDLGWPLLDQVESKNDNATTAYGESALYSYAQDYSGEARPPEGQFSISINGSIGPYVGDFLPGDWCSIIIDDNFVRERLASDLEPRGDVIVRKIIGYKVSVPDAPSFPEKVDLELISEWKEDRRISTLKITQ